MRFSFRGPPKNDFSVIFRPIFPKFLSMGASHSFIATSCVSELSLEVKTLEKSLYVSSPLGTRLSVDLIC